MLEAYKIPLIILGSVLVLVVVSWIANSFPRQSVLDDYLRRESIRITEKYEADIKIRDEKIKILNDRILASEKILKDINVTVKKLEAQKQNVQKPITTKEIKDRFDKLGYPTIN